MKSGSAPAWARKLVLTVCSDASMAPPAVLRWRRLGRSASSGVANRHTASIAVSAGSDPADARHTLLHELAHWIAPDERRKAGRRWRSVHHGETFYRHAFALFARHEPPLLDALRRDATRYPSCLRQAVAFGVDGARDLAGERKTLSHRRPGSWRVLVPEHPVRIIRRDRWYVCAICGRRLVARTLARAARRGARERHTLWTRQPAEATA